MVPYPAGSSRWSPLSAVQHGPVHGVAGAADELCHQGVPLPAGLGAELPGPEGRLGHREAFFNVERPGPALGEAVIVVEAVGHVAALLGLQQEGAPADGVDAARVNLEEVPRTYGDLPEELPPPLPLHHLPQLPGAAGVVADDDGGVRIAVQYVPALGLAGRAVFVEAGVAVVRVDLDAQILPGVQQLHQQGEALPRKAAEQRPLLPPQAPQGLAGPALDPADSAGVAADGPALPGMPAGDVVAKAGPQPVPAPDLLLEHGL